MKFLCFGAGAIGTYIGGSLAAAGHEVVFLERPESAAELARKGINLRISDGSHRIEKPFVAERFDEAAQLGPYDAGLLAIKAYDTAAFARENQVYAESMPPIVCFQNGVENEILLGETFGENKVIHATVTSSVGRKGVGDIQLERLRGIGISALHPISARLYEAFQAAGLQPELYRQPVGMKWSKMLVNLMGNATSAILDMTPAEIYTNPGLYRLEIEMLRECLAVMKALRIQVVDLPRTPVRLLAWALRRLPVSISRPLLIKSVGSGRGAKLPSFHLDLHSRRGKSEVNYYNGAVARFGKQAGIGTPVNCWLTRVLTDLTEGRMELAHYAHQPAGFLSDFKERQSARYC